MGMPLAPDADHGCFDFGPNSKMEVVDMTVYSPTDADRELADYARWLRDNYENGKMDYEQIGRNLLSVGFGKDFQYDDRTELGHVYTQIRRALTMLNRTESDGHPADDDWERCAKMMGECCSRAKEIIDGMDEPFRDGG